MAVEITDLMFRFRDESRNIWNDHFRILENPQSHEVQYTRDKIETELFRAIVALPMGIPSLADSYRRKPLREILVRPKDIFAEVPVQIGTRGRNENVTWSNTSLLPSAALPLLIFFDFFDWDSYGHVNMASVRASAEGDNLYLIADMYCVFEIASDN